jgi:hypothetical protein
MLMPDVTPVCFRYVFRQASEWNYVKFLLSLWRFKPHFILNFVVLNFIFSYLMMILFMPKRVVTCETVDKIYIAIDSLWISFLCKIIT